MYVHWQLHYHQYVRCVDITGEDWGPAVATAYAALGDVIRRNMKLRFGYLKLHEVMNVLRKIYSLRTNRVGATEVAGPEMDERADTDNSTDRDRDTETSRPASGRSVRRVRPDPRPDPTDGRHRRTGTPRQPCLWRGPFLIHFGYGEQTISTPSSYFKGHLQC